MVNQPDTTECPVRVYARRRAHKFRVVLASAEQSRADLESSDELVLIAGSVSYTHLTLPTKA